MNKRPWYLISNDVLEFLVYSLWGTGIIVLLICACIALDGCAAKRPAKADPGLTIHTLPTCVIDVVHTGCTVTSDGVILKCKHTDVTYKVSPNCQTIEVKQ